MPALSTYACGFATIPHNVRHSGSAAMSPAARYLWHQRLAWLLMVYAAAIGWSIAPEFAFGGINVGFCLGWLMVSAMVMACVKDSALRGRPVPFAWRQPMAGTFPIAVPIVEWRARRWWGLLWVALHACLLLATLIAAHITVWIAGQVL